jgi:hypothetical protein
MIMRTKKKTRRVRVKSDNSDKSPISRFKHLDSSGISEPPKMLDFVLWLAIPKSLREPRTHRLFAEKIGVNIDTLTDWKKRRGFWDEVYTSHTQYIRRFTSDISYGLVQQAKTGSEREVRLYMELFEGFSKKVRVQEEVPTSKISVEDKKILSEALHKIGLASLIATESTIADEDEEIDVGV